MRRQRGNCNGKLWQFFSIFVLQTSTFQNTLLHPIYNFFFLVWKDGSQKGLINQTEAFFSRRLSGQFMC